RALGISTYVEANHLDHCGAAEAVDEACHASARRVQDSGGTLVACLDDPGARAIAHAAADRGAEVIGYGTAQQDPAAASASFRTARVIPVDAQGQSQTFTLRL